MLEEEYQQRRVLPPHLRAPAPPEAPFEYAIRDAVLADMPAVREIYNYYVANSTVTFDEDAMTLREWKAKFSYLHELGMPCLVAASPSGQLLGYALVAPVEAEDAPTATRSRTRSTSARPPPARDSAARCSQS